ncbi:MAG: carbon-nitrogen hydrolase family protein [Rhodothermales bacterium]|nr:carbon-nitrogen hydrolase family protein [Rhodothermales bacterium]
MDDVMPTSVAAIQMCSGPDREANLSVAETLIAEAAGLGANLISLPENFSFLGRPEEKLAEAEDPERSHVLDFLRDQAQRRRAYVIGGSIPIRTEDPKRVSNSCFALDPHGEIVARYDKMHLFDVSIDEENTFRESDHVRPGNETVVFEAAGIKVGLSICFDIRFPELYRRLSFAGAHLVFVPSAFTVPTGRAHWDVLLRARAIENLCYVAAPAQIGEHIPGRKSYGKSMIVDPWGTVVAVAPDRPSVISAELDADLLTRIRNRLPALDRRRNDVFPP